MSLVAHWKLDESSGNTATDSSGGGQPGTLNGNPVWVAGKIGGALEFDGVGDNVNITNTINPSTVTVTAWVKGNVAASGSEFYSIFTTNSDGIILRYGDCINRSCFPVFIIIDASSGAHFAYNSSILQANQWYFLVGTYDGTDLRLYVNGVEGSNSGTSGSVKSNAGLGERIGVHANGVDGPMNGAIDDVRIYDHAFSAQEVRDLFDERGRRFSYSGFPKPILRR